MTTPAFRPTHVVPRHGLPAWEAPDPSRPTAGLDPLLPVRLTESRGDWGHVLCSNGWSAWVDGRRLVAVPEDPPASDAPPARTADPRPLLTRVQETLARYLVAAENLAEGGLDGEAFRQRTRGLRVGIVVDGESAWLYDSAHGRWLYTDGAHLQPYAADEPPREAPEPAPPAAAAEPAPRPRTPAHPPTRVVPEAGEDGGPAAPEEPGPAAGARSYTPTRVVPDEAVPREAPSGQTPAPGAGTPPGTGGDRTGAPAGPRAPDAVPTRVVSGPPDVSRRREPGPAGAGPDAGAPAAQPSDGRAGAPERPADGPDGPAGHPPTRVVSGSGPPPGHKEPTRVVNPGAGTSDEP
ncbi:hypothetical protein [Streptomyces sp. enrichment culture]|uniref:hypothetical protein n=1 Tax=Streptomyces sp. enrichment culture TaxID=1795815 RepID=UPI003F561DC9